MKSKIEVLAFDVSETLQTGSDNNDEGLGQPMLDEAGKVIPGAFSVLVGGRATATLLQEAQKAGIRVVLVTNNGADLDKAVVLRTLAFLAKYGVHLEPDVYMGPPPSNSAAAVATGGSKIPRLDEAVRRFAIDKSQLRFFDDSRANHEEAVAAGYDSVRVKNATDLAAGIQKAIDSRLILAAEAVSVISEETSAQLFVRTLTKAFNIDYNPETDTIAHIKRKIFAREGVPVEEQMLLFAAEIGLDSRLVEEYQPQKLGRIHLVIKHQQLVTPAQEVIEEAEKNTATLRTLIAKWKTKTEDMEERNEPEAYKAANAVYTVLNDRSEAYFAEPTRQNFIGLKTAFEDSLDQKKNDNRKALETHRGYKELLGNIALAIIGVVVLYLIAAAVNKAVKGKFLFFETASEELMKDTEKVLNNQNAPPV